MGKFNHCAPFVTDYKRVAAPLVALLSGEKAGEWRKEHTDALNAICTLIWKGIDLTLVD